MSTWATNIGAKLQTEQAEADKRVAQAKAEVRRAAAVAVEQENARQDSGNAGQGGGSRSAGSREMAADAFRSGNLGIMDYVRMKNVAGRHIDARMIIAGRRQTAHRGNGRMNQCRNDHNDVNFSNRLIELQSLINSAAHREFIFLSSRRRRFSSEVASRNGLRMTIKRRSTSVPERQFYFAR